MHSMDDFGTNNKVPLGSIPISFVFDADPVSLLDAAYARIADEREGQRIELMRPHRFRENLFGLRPHIIPGTQLSQTRPAHRIPFFEQVYMGLA